MPTVEWGGIGTWIWRRSNYCWAKTYTKCLCWAVVSEKCGILKEALPWQEACWKWQRFCFSEGSWEIPVSGFQEQNHCRTLFYQWCENTFFTLSFGDLSVYSQCFVVAGFCWCRDNRSGRSFGKSGCSDSSRWKSSFRSKWLLLVCCVVVTVILWIVSWHRKRIEMPGCSSKEWAWWYFWRCSNKLHNSLWHLWEIKFSVINPANNFFFHFKVNC